MTAAEEAKQLDSVTDVVQEGATINESKAQDAMSALKTNNEISAEDIRATKIKVSKEDVDLIVLELEVSEDVAIWTLREVSLKESGGWVVAKALRKLIVS